MAKLLHVKDPGGVRHPSRLTKAVTTSASCMLVPTYTEYISSRGAINLSFALFVVSRMTKVWRCHRATVTRIPLGTIATATYDHKHAKTDQQLQTHEPHTPSSHVQGTHIHSKCQPLNPPIWLLGRD